MQLRDGLYVICARFPTSRVPTSFDASRLAVLKETVDLQGSNEV